MSPIFLTLDDVLESYAEQVATYGGGEGLRDFGLLQSAGSEPESWRGPFSLAAGISIVTLSV